MGGREGGGRDGEGARESTRQRKSSSEGKSAKQVACQGLAHVQIHITRVRLQGRERASERELDGEKNSRP